MSEHTPLRQDPSLLHHCRRVIASDILVRIIDADGDPSEMLMKELAAELLALKATVESLAVELKQAVDANKEKP